MMIINDRHTCQQGHIVMSSHGEIVAVSARPITARPIPGTFENGPWVIEEIVEPEGSH